MALDRFGARRAFGIGAVLLALGLFLSSRAQGYWQLALSYGVVSGLGITILGLGPQAGLIARWFRRKRGIALGVAFAGTGLGALIMTPRASMVLTGRAALEASGGVAAVTSKATSPTTTSPN